MSDVPGTEAIIEALRGVQAPDLGRDVVSLHLVHDLAYKDGIVYLTLRPSPPSEAARRYLEAETKRVLLGLPGIKGVELKHDPPRGAAAPPAAPEKIGVPGVKHIIAIGSGKGGVGKTTISVNLAIALAELGASVGLMDADVYGPNVPRMMGINQMPRVVGGNRIEPLAQYGVRLISMGFLNPGDKPVIWRGPMLHSAVQQFLRQVAWGELDYLLIDLPPGTGDVSLTLAQTTSLSGAVVITTPSEVSLEDGRKALNMFRHLNIEVLGLVENMGSFVCPHCQHSVDIFSQGGGERMAAEFETTFLGSLPLDPSVRAGGDAGRPAATEGPESITGRPFYELAKRLAARVAQTAPEPENWLHVRA